MRLQYEKAQRRSFRGSKNITREASDALSCQNKIWNEMSLSLLSQYNSTFYELACAKCLKWNLTACGCALHYRRLHFIPVTYQRARIRQAIIPEWPRIKECAFRVKIRDMFSQFALSLFGMKCVWQVQLWIFYRNLTCTIVMLKRAIYRYHTMIAQTGPPVCKWYYGSLF